MQIAEELPPAPRIRRLRVGIDTGGTFTDVVAFDEATGEIFTTKTPTTPHDPSVGVHRRHPQDRATRSGRAAAAMASARRLARHDRRHQRAARRSEFPGARASSPPRASATCWRSRARRCHRATATRYFWVKPERIVPAAPGTRGARAAELPRRGAAPVRRGGGRARWPRWFREHGIDCIGVCFLHAYANGDARAAHARDPRARASRGARVDLVGGAARVPRVRARGDDARRRVRQAARGRLRRRHPGRARAPRSAPARRSTS